jgi:putative zinc finger protein
MTLLACAAVRRRLQAFYDRELPIADLISVEAHLHDCPPCERDLRELQNVTRALRLAAAPPPPDDWTGVRSGVISRMRAEAHESFAARARRGFDNLHLVWIAAAATAATCVCAGTVLSMLHFASPERQDSLAAVIAVMAAPSGSELNLARLDGRFEAPRVTENGVLYATLEGSTMEGDLVLPLSAIVTREGRLSGVERRDRGQDLRDVMDVVDALSRSRLEPAQFGGSSVAVNLVSMSLPAAEQEDLMHSLPGHESWPRRGLQRLNLVWLVAHTTVRGKT